MAFVFNDTDDYSEVITKVPTLTADEYFSKKRHSNKSSVPRYKVFEKQRSKALQSMANLMKDN